MGKRTNTAKWMEKQRRWQINVQKDGERRSFYSSKPGRTGQREANAKADAWLDEGVDSSGKRADDLLDKYLEIVESTTSFSNYRKEKYHVDNYIRPAIGHKKISSVTEQDFQSIINRAYRKKDIKTGNVVELSRKSLSNIRATIMAFWKMCRKDRATAIFLEDLTIPQGARLKGTSILQPKDLAILFSKDTTTMRGKDVFDEYIYAYRFAVLTGLRPGELRGITRDCIDGYRISIKQSLNSYNEITQGKNENAVRAFVMAEIAKQTLNMQIAQIPADQQEIFYIPSMSTFRHRWKRYCLSNGIEPVSLYALRHTFVSVVKNLPEGSVKALVGHSHSMDTFGVYGHALTGDDELIANDVNGIFVSLLNNGL